MQRSIFSLPPNSSSIQQALAMKDWEKLSESLSQPDGWDAVVGEIVKTVLQDQRFETLEWLLTKFAEQEASLKAFRVELLYLAITSNQLLVLKELIKPLTEGGRFGLSLDELNETEKRPPALLAAIEVGRIDLFKELTKPMEEGGFGLPLTLPSQSRFIARNAHFHRDIIQSVINFDQLDLLKELIKPKSEGGCELSLSAVEVSFLRVIPPRHLMVLGASEKMIYVYNKTLACTVIYLLRKLSWSRAINFLKDFITQQVQNYRNYLEDIGKEKLSLHSRHSVSYDKKTVEYWLEHVVQIKSVSGRDFRKTLFEGFNRIIQKAAMLPELPSQFEEYIELFDDIQRGAGRLLLATSYEDRGDYISFYEFCLSVYQDGACDLEIKREAAAKLFGSIFGGEIILNADGSINHELSENQKTLNNTQRTEQAKNPRVMLERAVHAYEFCDDERWLRILDGIMSGEKGVVEQSSIEKTWCIDATMQFFNYYRQKNPQLLTIEQFKKGLEKMASLLAQPAAEARVEASSILKRPRDGDEDKDDLAESAKKRARTF